MRTMQIKALADALGEYLVQLLAPVGKRLRDAEQRLTALEETALQYRGIFDASGDYRRGSCVTHSGGLWIAYRDPEGSPGDAGSGWRLAVKSGAKR